MQVVGCVVTCLLLFVACPFGVAIYALSCPITVTAQRVGLPLIPVPPEVPGQARRTRTLGSMSFKTYLSVADVHRFLQRELVAEGWERPKANPETNRMFVAHKLACPYEAAEIRVRALSPTQTLVSVHPYPIQSPGCGDCN